MVLHRFYRQSLVAKTHYFAVFGFGGNFECIGQRGALNGERMVAHRLEALVERCENAAAIVPYAASLAVHEPLRRHDARAEGLRNRLVAEADAEYRKLAREGFHRRKRYPRRVGIAGPRRKNERRRLFRRDFVDRNLVVARDFHFRAQRTERLNEVVCERIVIVNEEYHGSKEFEGF